MAVNVMRQAGLCKTSKHVGYLAVEEFLKFPVDI